MINSNHIKTIGNATFIAYENNKPILSTDPWLNGHLAYFGSWNLSHKIPFKIEQDIKSSKNIWLSHGHPDHINPESIKYFKSSNIFVPDHYGNRIYKTLKDEGYKINILKSRKWYSLTDHIKILSISNPNQDGILLVSIKNNLFIDSNDSEFLMCRKFVKKVSNNHKKSFLMSISGYGDADMINIFDENKNRIIPEAAKKNPVGERLNQLANQVGATHVIPFSSFHKYVREDSIWAEKYTTPLSAYKEKFDFKKFNYVEPFCSYDIDGNQFEKIYTEKTENIIYKAKEFGDDWDEKLNNNELKIINEYFQKLKLLKKKIDFINLRIGNTENFISFNKKNNKGITFELPKNLLINAVNYEVFDDLLIGNIMKTTFHNINSLYDIPFSPIVGKWADNGYVYDNEEYKKYLKYYRENSNGDWLREYFETISKNFVRKFIKKDNYLHKGLKEIYNKIQNV